MKKSSIFFDFIYFIFKLLCGILTKINRIINGSIIENNPNSFNELFDVYNQNCQRLDMESMSKKAFEDLFGVCRENIFIIRAFSSDGETIAVAFYIATGDTLLYFMNGSTEKGRQDFATSLIAWEGMLEGKRRQCKWFDFDGIYDERFNKAQRRWQGFTRFKSGFGGQEVTYLGSFVKWLPFLRR